MLRGWLAKNTRTREVVDFRDAIVFPRVGINTAIVRLTGSKAIKKATFRRYKGKTLPLGYRSGHLSDPDFFVENKTPLSSLGTESWIVTDKAGEASLSKIDRAGTRVGEVLHVGKGMETGSNNSFVIPAENKSLLSVAKKANLVYRRARNSDIEAFHISEAGPYLLYVEDCPSLASLPREVQRHLTAQKSSLKVRKAHERGDCDWWRYAWPLHEGYVKKPKILVPYRARTNCFVVNEEDAFLGITDTTVLFDNDQPESLQYIAAVLNSKLLNYRFRFIGKLAGGGSYEYFHNTVAKLPIPRRKVGDKDHDRLVKLAKSISDDYLILKSTQVKKRNRCRCNSS